MSRLTSEHYAPAYAPQPQGYYPPASSNSGGLSAGALLTGLIVVGVGAALAWYYLGPDVRRYLKIRSM